MRGWNQGRAVVVVLMLWVLSTAGLCETTGGGGSDDFGTDDTGGTNGLDTDDVGGNGGDTDDVGSNGDGTDDIGGNNGATNGDSTGSDDADITVSPEELEVVHVYGVTSCPQLVGKFTIENDTDNNTSFSLVADPVDEIQRLALDPGFGEIEAQQDFEVEVSFNCAAAESFTTNVRVQFAGNEPAEIVVPVTVTVDM